jgi:hypothetical protein
MRFYTFDPSSIFLQPRKQIQEPRRPPDAEQLYYIENKAKVLKQNSTLRHQDVRKILSERFPSLDTEQKALYIEEAAKATEEYQRKMKQFL